MLCEILKSFGTQYGKRTLNFQQGDVVDVPDDRVAAWKKSGLVSPVDKMAEADAAMPQLAEREKAVRNPSRERRTQRR